MAIKVLVGANAASPLFEFTDTSISSCSLYLKNTMSGNELTVDELTPEVFEASYEFGNAVMDSNYMPLIGSDGVAIVTSNADAIHIDDTPYGTPVRYYVDNTLIGKFYLESVERTSTTTFTINAVSAVGLLEREQHFGDLYNGSSLSSVLADVIGSTVPYTVDAAIANISMYGWLPIETKRQALHQICFATGIILRKNNNGDIYFTSPSNTVKNIPDSRIYMGGTVSTAEQVSKVLLTEHEWLQSSTGQEVTLYDNLTSGETATNALISFNEPCYDLEATGLTIGEHGVNYAYVTGTGTLTGTKYTHTQRVVEKVVSSTNDDNTVSCTDAYLVNMANSATVLDRLESYYRSGKTVRLDIVLNDEKPGDRVSYTDPFGATDTAFISAMNIRSSTKQKASLELISGFEPPDPGNTYHNYVLLTGSGTWTVPSGVTRIKAVMIQGGQGGHGGYSGGLSSYKYETLSQGWIWSGTEGGAGGNGGESGSAGKVYTIDLMNLSASYQYQCGSGGAGGTSNNAGTAGGETTFGTYSSASGAVRVDGYKNIFTGVVYATTNVSGIAGVAGGNYRYHQVGSSLTYSGQTWNGGTYGSDMSHAYGGNGGGAAYGAAGGNGGNGHYEPIGIQEQRYKGGAGGTGATAAYRAVASTYGQAGAGGNGGGGGGCPGECDQYSYWYHPGERGQGGAGSNGCPGGDGLIIVYY